MGIKYLNRYLKKHCNKGIEYNISIEKLKGKTIVVDTSIYIYKFLEENALLENFFILITQFREYKITPLFIFDGKADASKMDLLWKRVLKKRDAWKEYEKLKETIPDESNARERQYMLDKMEICRKNSTRIKENDLVELKQLFDAMGVFYHVATKEADVVCAYFVNKGFAWGCMSDDMDMFVYGCNFVLREWNIHKKTGLLYDRNQIMREIWVKPEYFSQVLLLMGSDYNQEICKNEVISVQTAFKWYDEFMKHVIIGGLRPPLTPGPVIGNQGFYNWLENTKKITSENNTKLRTISDMFRIPESMDDDFILSSSRKKTTINWMELRKLLAPQLL